MTDTSVASEREVTYTENDEGRDTTEETLLYYPTGGFAGVIAPDAYEKWYDKTYDHLRGVNSDGSIDTGGRSPKVYNVLLPDDLKGEGFGYFSNCFYDMQTSAMREIAVGQENPKASSDGSGEKPAFSVTGITGLYTEESDVKDMDGLTDLPSKSHAMDSQAGNSTVWKYEKGYYPQLKSYMQFERKSDEDGAWYKPDGTQATADEVKQFPFYMEETVAKTDGSETHEVKGVADNKTVLLTVYRYAQASTSTVFLDHWDYKMNIANGGLSTDNNWACGVESNKMTYNPDTGYWEITYDNLEAGTYNFKVQANDTMTFNYGRDKFDGEDCTFTAQDGDTVVIKFKYTDLRSANYRILADFYSEDSDGTPREENVVLGGLSEEAPAEVWGVVGSFSGSEWNVESSDYDMTRSAADTSIYTATIPFTPTYDDAGQPVATQFKIAKDHKWDESYGLGGSSSGTENNMMFTVTESCDVTFEFNNKTHLTTVTANPKDAIKDVFTDDTKKFDFTGYSVIGSSDLTGFNWLESEREVEAAEKGKMTETSPGSGIYEVTFYNIPMGKNYAYKVIKDAVNEGARSYFHINAYENPEVDNPTCTVTIRYNSRTGRSTVSARYEGSDKEYATTNLGLTYYTVLGAEGLTGYHWLGDSTHPEDQSAGSVEKYKQEAIEAGRMEPVPGSTNLFRKTFNNVSAGTYGFKVAPEGSFDFAYGDNGSEDNYNITLSQEADVTITFNSDTSIISVSSNPPEALATTTYVVTGTDNLMGKTWDTKEAVMSFNEENGVYEYIKENVPSRDNYAYKIIEYDKDSGDNISFYLAGDKARYNIKFIYDPRTGASYVEVIDIDTGETLGDDLIQPVKVTTYSVLGEEALTGYIWEGRTDNGATAATPENKKRAAAAGLMTQRSDGKYVKVYRNIPCGREGEITTYAFKVAANGTWDSGISYGDGNGGNFIFALNGDELGRNYCDVTIVFDPATGQISVSTTPAQCLVEEVDDSKFEWYIVGDYTLVSQNAFAAGPTVYDTVRDITSDFDFTSGEDSIDRGVKWQIDAERNTINEFYTHLADGKGFDLQYSVGGYDTTGKFNDPVVDLSAEVLELNEEAISGQGTEIAHYYCDTFMPGKQWVSVATYGFGFSKKFDEWKSEYKSYQEYLENSKALDDMAAKYYVLIPEITEKTVQAVIDYLEVIYNDDPDTYREFMVNYGDIGDLYTKVQAYVTAHDTNGDGKVDLDEGPGSAPLVAAESGGDQTVIGSRLLRLIPAAYLEAGNDAEICVLQDSRSADSPSLNRVIYNDNSSEYVTFTGMQDSYEYYNFAFTSGYIITDKIGLGLYANYINQNQDGRIVTFNADPKQRREQDDFENNYKEGGVYYAMSTAFTQSAKYEDIDGTHDEKLYADELINQSVIGDAYDYNSDTNPEPEKKNYAQTIVKIYQVDVSTGNRTKLDFAHDEESQAAETEEYNNYLKWSGQKKFTADDAGMYEVVFYWAMSDGRYLIDSKNVFITPIEPGISKEVDKKYDETAENTGEPVFGTSGEKKNTVTYTVTYNNPDKEENSAFAVLDILPFAGDKRLNTDDVDASDLETSGDMEFTIESLTVRRNGSATVKGVYYSTSTAVRELLTKDDSSGGSEAREDSAQDLPLNPLNGTLNTADGTWKSLTAGPRDGNTVSYTDSAKGISGVTAIVVSGVQVALDETIKLTVKLSYDGDTNDLLVNNAYYYTSQTSVASGINGYSDPVTTAIVGRDISGYVWLDSDVDGIYDEEESPIENVKVILLKKNGEGDNGEGDYVQVPGAVAYTDKDGYYSFGNLPEGDYRISFIESDRDDGNVKIHRKEPVGTDPDGTEPGGTEPGETDNVEIKNFSQLNLTKTLVEEQCENVVGSRSIADSDLNISGVQLPDADSLYNYSFIPDENIPVINVALDNYAFSKKYQNVGLTDNPVPCSITLIKNGANGEGLNHVEFKLEYYDKEDNAWHEVGYIEGKPVYYGDENYNSSTVLKRFKTGEGYINLENNESGKLYFPQLKEGKYRITETNTVKGYNLLSSSIDVELAYKLSPDVLETDAKVSGVIKPNNELNNYDYKDSQGNLCYRDITLTINNTTRLDQYLPMTGEGSVAGILLAALALLLVGTAIFLYASRRKKRAGKTDVKSV